METLIQVGDGDDNIVVGISGFGSAKIGERQWADLAKLTGRTALVLKYDAQELPWEIAKTAPTAAATETLKRWSVARDGADIAAKYLSRWLERWVNSDKSVLIIGFSLGAYIAWESTRSLPVEVQKKIQVVLISGALADIPEAWKRSRGLMSLVNVYSTQDMALRWLYPRAVGPDETPAAGLGPITSSKNNLTNIDVTDLIAHDHLWAAKNLAKLVKLSIGCMWGAKKGTYSSPEEVSSHPLSSSEAARLYRWAFVDPDLWEVLGRALNGNLQAIRTIRGIDQWSKCPGRMPSLLSAGSTVKTLMNVEIGHGVARRSAQALRGMIRYWISESGKQHENFPVH